MSDIAIRVENLGKRYQIGELASLRMLGRKFKRTVGMGGATAGSAGEENANHFWALKDVSFEVKKGEVLGVIGRNGAGKSTLLKLLSRITVPTTGQADIHGRVGSLLEVGTGFHPELTGRENIFLSGSILGMRKREIQSKFDEIVDFAGVEKFLETPVKRYSSGMGVRLGFAIAAHLSPEVLIVDEVLAVGDAEFQKKCLGKMKDVTEGEGRTVLFVSHNMASIQALCTRGILLKQGSIELDSDVRSITSRYLTVSGRKNETEVQSDIERTGKAECRVTGINVSSPGMAAFICQTGSQVEVSIAINKPVANGECCFTVKDHYGIGISHFSTFSHNESDERKSSEVGRFICSLPVCPFLPGTYSLDVAVITNGIVQDHILSLCEFSVSPGYFEGRMVNAEAGTRTMVSHRWEMCEDSVAQSAS